MTILWWLNRQEWLTFKWVSHSPVAGSSLTILQFWSVCTNAQSQQFHAMHNTHNNKTLHRSCTSFSDEQHALTYANVHEQKVHKCTSAPCCMCNMHMHIYVQCHHHDVDHVNCAYVHCLEQFKPMLQFCLHAHQATCHWGFLCPRGLF